MGKRKDLQDYQDDLKALADRLAQVGFMSRGSVVQRYTHCAAPGCRCHRDPPQLHGPYWQWSTVVAGKTVTRRLTEAQARVYKEWIANRQVALEVLAQIEELSRQASEIVLQQAATFPDHATRAG